MANKYRLKFTLSNGEEIDAGEIVVPEGAKGDKGDKGDPGTAGAKGADGYSPVKGVDYFTDTDKAAIVQEVLAALPYYDGTVTITGGETLISFTIGATTYQAVEGMTWGEWVDSSYNTNGFYVTSDSHVFTAAGANVVLSEHGTDYVMGSDLIVSDYSYHINTSGGSN